MRKVMAVLTGALVSVGVVSQGLAGTPRESQRSGKQVAVSFRLATTTPTRGFERMSLGNGGTIHVAPRPALSANEVTSVRRDGSDVSLSLTDEAAGRFGTTLSKHKADQLAVFAGGKLIGAGPVSFDARGGLARISGLSSAQASRITRVVGVKTRVPVGTSIALVPSQTAIQAGESLTLEVYVRGGFSDLRAYQAALTITGGESGELTPVNLWIDDTHAEYVFRGLDKLDAVDRTGGRLGAVLLSGGTQAMESGYLGSYTLEASPEASGTFYLNVRTEDSSLVANTGSQFIRYATGRDTVITVGDGTRVRPSDK